MADPTSSSDGEHQADDRDKRALVDSHGTVVGYDFDDRDAAAREVGLEL